MGADRCTLAYAERSVLYTDTENSLRSMAYQGYLVRHRSQPLVSDIFSPLPTTAAEEVTKLISYVYRYVKQMYIVYLQIEKPVVLT